MTTKGASFAYEEVIDLHTESDRVTVIGIHTPISDTPRRMAPGLFSQFKRFKYLGCSVTLVPAATLPVDPLAVSYESGEPHIDPRDMLNPILFHGCHGNDLGAILNRIYSAGLVEGSDLSQILDTDSLNLWSMAQELDAEQNAISNTLLESLYYRALTDRTWQKAQINRGFRKTGLHPRVYSLATNMQLQNEEALFTGRLNAPAPFYGMEKTDEFLGDGYSLVDPASNPVRFFTPRTVRLGWLDTRQVVGYDPFRSKDYVPEFGLGATIGNEIKNKTVDTKLPKIFMGIILLPPAYKQEQYFRMVITHRFAFAGFRGISMSNVELEAPNYFNLNEKLSDGDSDPPEPGPSPDPDPDPDPGPSPDPDPDPDPVPGTAQLVLRDAISSFVYRTLEAIDENGTVLMRVSADPDTNVGITTASIVEGQKAGVPLFFKLSGMYYPRPCVVMQDADDDLNALRLLTMSGSSPSQSTIQSVGQFRSALLTGVGFASFMSQLGTFDKLIEVLNWPVVVGS